MLGVTESKAQNSAVLTAESPRPLQMVWGTPVQLTLLLSHMDTSQMMMMRVTKKIKQRR